MNDFSSALRDHVAKPLPPLPSAHEIAIDIARRDQRRTRLLAVLCLLFWVAAVAGMVLMVTGLNEFLMGVRLGNARRSLQPAVERGAEASKTAPSVPRESSAEDAKPGDGSKPAHDGVPGPYWDDGTSLFHHTLPLIDGSMVLLLLAGASTVLLVFSSRRTTLNRINISLAQISEQLKSLGPPPRNVVAEKTRPPESPASTTDDPSGGG